MRKNRVCTWELYHSVESIVIYSVFLLAGLDFEYLGKNWVDFFSLKEHLWIPLWSQKILLTIDFLLMMQGSERHGNSCYMVTSHEQSYEDATVGYYCQGHLLTIENRCFILFNVALFYTPLFGDLFVVPIMSCPVMWAGLNRHSSTVY